MSGTKAREHFPYSQKRLGTRSDTSPTYQVTKGINSIEEDFHNLDCAWATTRYLNGRVRVFICLHTIPKKKACFFSIHCAKRAWAYTTDMCPPRLWSLGDNNTLVNITPEDTPKLPVWAALVHELVLNDPNYNQAMKLALIKAERTYA